MLTVWSSTQTPHLCRGTLADLFERNLESIRVIAPLVGGGFGTKAPFYPEEAVIPAAAMKLGRPVKWQEDRREHFLAATQERDQYWKVAIAVDGREKSSACAAPCCTTPAPICRGASSCRSSRRRRFPGPYVVPAYKIESDGRAHQPRADHGGARRRPAAGGVRHGAADGPRRARTQPRSRRSARAQHDPARADALFGRTDLP